MERKLVVEAKIKRSEFGVIRSHRLVTIPRLRKKGDLQVNS